tara:strand:+ start:1604 stop:1999 length:396 start_codon:yes stop_codon:yes gene_type:complete
MKEKNKLNDIFKNIEEIIEFEIDFHLCSMHKKSKIQNSNLKEEYTRIQEVLEGEKEVEAVKKIMKEVSVDMFYRMFELFDGYRDKDIKIELIDYKTNKKLKKTKEFHDLFMTFIADKEDSPPRKSLLLRGT